MEKMALRLYKQGKLTPKRMRRYLEQDPGVVVPCLPETRPELRAVEAVLQKARHRPIAAELYKTLWDLKAAVSECFRTCYVKADIAYLVRNV